MFLKIDKKVLIILIIALIVLVLAGVAFWKYFTSVKVTNTAGGASTQNNTPQVQIQAGGIKTGGSAGTGTLSICVDKCGDGICQKADPTCKDGMNCVCPETKTDCPQDCPAISK